MQRDTPTFAEGQMTHWFTSTGSTSARTHLGKAVLMGDIIYLCDDLSNGGITSFDISPVFQIRHKRPVDSTT